MTPAIWLLTAAGTGIAAILTTGEIGAPVSLASAILFSAAVALIVRSNLVPVRIFLGRHERALVLMAFGIGLADWLWVGRPFLVALPTFLLALLVTKSAVPRDRTGDLQLLGLSFAVLLSASTLAADWSFLLFFAVYAVAATAALIALQWRDDAQVALPPNAPRLVTRWLAVSAVMATGFTVAVFVVFPRLNISLFRPTALSPMARTGYAELVTPGGGAIREDDTVVMRVTVDPPEAATLWPGYLRGATLERFDGAVWRPALRRWKPLGRSRTGYTMVRPRDAEPHLLHQTVYLEPIGTPVIFAAPEPLTVDIPVPNLYLRDDGAITRAAWQTGRVRYEVVSDIPRWTAADLRAVAGEASRATRHDRRQPGDSLEALATLSNPLPERARALAERVARRSRSPYDAARALESFFRNEFRYTLDPGPVPAGEDPTLHFLFTRRAGHCQEFSSAMALLLRQLGIPCRVALGFLRGEWNAAGGYFVIRAKDAHAWVEVWVDGAGWVLFDPSPRARTAGAPTTLAAWTREGWDWLNLQWNRYVLTYDLERQIEVTTAATQRSVTFSHRLRSRFMDRVRALFAFGDDGAGGATPGASAPRRSRLPLVALGAFFLAIALAGWTIWRATHGAGFRWFDEGRFTEFGFYQQLLEKLSRRGLRPRPSETAREFAGRAAGHLTSAGREAVSTLTRLYESGRFGGLSLSRDERDRLPRLLESL